MNTEFLKQLGIEDENPRIVLQKLGKESTETLKKKELLEQNGNEEAIRELDELYAKIQQEKEIVAIEAQSYVEPETKTDTRGGRDRGRSNDKGSCREVKGLRNDSAPRR